MRGLWTLAVMFPEENHSSKLIGLSLCHGNAGSSSSFKWRAAKRYAIRVPSALRCIDSSFAALRSMSRTSASRLRPCRVARLCRHVFTSSSKSRTRSCAIGISPCLISRYQTWCRPSTLAPTLHRPDFRSPALRPSYLRAIADQERIVAVLRHLPPEILVAPERDHRVVGLLEVWIGGGDFVVELERRVEARFHDGRRERRQLGAGRDQAFKGRRIDGVIFRLHPSIGHFGSGAQHRLVGRRERIPLVDVDEVVEHRRAFPPARVIIELGDLLEAE